MTKWILALAAMMAVSGVSASTVRAAEIKEWTFMVYLNGDNNLDPYGTIDMGEMARVGSDANVNIVVLRDTPELTVSSKIYFIEKGNQVVVKDYGRNIDMGDWHNVVEFYKFVQAN